MRKTILAAAALAATIALDASADITVSFPSGSGIDSISGMKAPLLKFVNAQSRAEQGFEPFAVAVTDDKAVIPTCGGNEAEYVVVRFDDDTNMQLVAGVGEQLSVDVKSLTPFKAVYSGSPLLEGISELDELTAPILKRYNELATSPTPDEAAIKGVINEYNQEIKDYIEENLTSPKVVFAITTLTGEDYVNAFNRLSEGAKTSVYYPIAEKIYEQTNQVLEQERKLKELQDGAHAAPDFTLLDLQGKPVSLSQFKGKWVILDFWGSWCTWCIKGFPELKEAYAKYKDRLEIIGIDCQESEEAWKAGVRKYGLPWVNVYCPNGNPLLKDYGVNAFPTKAIVDPEGKIRNITAGHNKEFFTILDELMAE